MSVALVSVEAPTWEGVQQITIPCEWDQGKLVLDFGAQAPLAAEAEVHIRLNVPGLGDVFPEGPPGVLGLGDDTVSEGALLPEDAG